MKTKSELKKRIDLNMSLSITGYVLHKLINDRVKHPELYCLNGSCRKWSIQLGINHINKYRGL